MKKLIFVSCLLFIAAGFSFAGGITEYKGRNYFFSSVPNYVARYEAGMEISDIDLSTAVKDGTLYFICPAYAPETVLDRGFFQKGDTFLFFDDPRIVGTYTGAKKSITQSPLFPDFSKQGIAWVVGYSTRGKGITITEIFVTQEEVDALEQNLKEVK